MPRPTPRGYRAGVFRPDNDRAMPARHGIIVRDRAHRRADAVEDTFGIVRDMVRDAVRRLGGQHKDCRIVRAETLLDMVGGPWARLFVLGDAISVFPGMPERALVEVTGPSAADIH